MIHHCRLTDRLTLVLQVWRSDGQEGIWARHFLSITRSAAGRPSAPSISPRLHRRRSGRDVGSKRLLCDKTICCWRGGAAAAPMMQLGKTA